MEAASLSLQDVRVGSFLEFHAGKRVEYIKHLISMSNMVSSRKLCAEVLLSRFEAQIQLLKGIANWAIEGNLFSWDVRVEEQVDALKQLKLAAGFGHVVVQIVRHDAEVEHSIFDVGYFRLLEQDITCGLTILITEAAYLYSNIFELMPAQTRNLTASKMRKAIREGLDLDDIFETLKNQVEHELSSEWVYLTSTFFLQDRSIPNGYHSESDC